MTSYFFDTSALIKRYLPEMGSAWVRMTTNPAPNHVIFIAHITGIELVSGMARRVREGTLTLIAAKQARQTANQEAHQHFVTIGFTATVDQQVQDILERHPLRAYDALQLASAAHCRLVALGQAGGYLCGSRPTPVNGGYHRRPCR